MQKVVKCFGLAVYMIPCLFLFSCIDESYDLDDIDMTIGSYVDLTLPACSTSEITLKNIMDLEDDDIVKIVDGDFYLVEDGVADIPQIEIQNVVIKKPEIFDIDTSVDIDLFPKRNGQNKSPKKIVIGGIELPNFEYTYTIQEKDKAYYELQNTVSETITEEVVELQEIRLDKETSLSIDLETYFDKGIAFIDKVYLDNLYLTYPKGLNITSVVFHHMSFTDDGELIENIHDDVKIDNEKGVVYLTDGDVNTAIGQGRRLRIDVTFDKVVVGKGGVVFDPNTHILSMQGQFKVDGTFRVETDDINYKAFTQEQFEAVIRDKNFDAIIPNRILFKGEAEFANDIIANGFSGKVKRQVGEISPIKLDNLPDFMNDPEVVFDLENPVVYVEVFNPLPADAETAITMRSVYDNGKTIEKSTGKVAIPANAHTIFCLADHFENVKHPAEYPANNIQEIRIPALNELLAQIPKEIEVEVDDIEMEVNNLSLPGKYDVKVNYKIFTPLAFGEKFLLVYQDSETGWAVDIDEELAKIDAQEISLKAVAVSDLPLDLTFKVKPLDERGNEIKGLQVQQIGTIKANSRVTNVSFSIKPAKGHTLKEFLSGENGQKIDGVHYRAEAKAPQGGTLKETANLRLKDITISVKGCVSYDAN